MESNIPAKKKKIHRVEVKRELCIGAETCVTISQEGFEMDDKNIAIVRKGAHKLSDDELLLAAQCCPTAAIILYDSEGNQIFPLPDLNK